MSKGSTGEKTEQPTPKKLRDARKKGQVPRSQEVVSATSLFSVITVIWLSWGFIMENLTQLMDQMAALAATTPQSAMAPSVWILNNEVWKILTIIILAALIAGIFSNYLQFGSLFAMENLKPKLEKISPAKGFKRIFSKKQLVETLKSIAKILFLSSLLYIVISNSIGPAMAALPCGMPCLIEITTQMLKSLILYSALAFAIIALLDFVYQRKSHTKSLMMSKDEVKREYKESEGDPMIKGQRKQLAQELVMSDSGSSARKASAVVVNPTKFAIAIHHSQKNTDEVPRVTAKGRNLHAHFIRTEAEKAGVPIFLNVPLARSLYAKVSAGDQIEEEHYKAVAEILIWVSKNRDLLFNGPLEMGHIDMAKGDHLPPRKQTF